MSASNDKTAERHASLLTTLMDAAIEKMLQSKDRGEIFLEPLEAAVLGKFKACTTPDKRLAWNYMLLLVRSWRKSPTSPSCEVGSPS